MVSKVTRILRVDLLICAIAKIVHLQVEVEGVVNVGEDLQAILRHERVVVERLKAVQQGRYRLLGVGVVYQPARDIGIQPIRNCIEEILAEIQSCFSHLRWSWLTSSILATIAKLLELSFRVVSRKPYR